MLRKLRELLEDNNHTVYVFCDVVGSFQVCECTVDSVMLLPRIGQYTLRCRTGDGECLPFTEADYGKTLFESRSDAERVMLARVAQFEMACD